MFMGLVRRVRLLLPLQAIQRAHDPVRRIRLNHPRPQFAQTLRWTFFCMEDGGLRYPHFARGLRAGLPRAFSESLGRASQAPFRQTL